jgi:Domain of unknown function (DUF4157)
VTRSAVLAAEGAGLLGTGLPYDRASLWPMPRMVHAIVGSRVAAITLGSRIYVDRARLEGLVRGEDPELLAHELIHVAQWRRDGVVAFLSTYIRDYVRLRILGLSHAEAYRRIGYEWVAYSDARHIVESS